jgi:LuxR family maltose regulon positive regulatory protein
MYKTADSMLLLPTKLHAPTPRPDDLPRPRLIEQITPNNHRTLTLVSAPAGFGKSTLLGTWCQQTHTPVAWLSLESEENDPFRLLTYLIAALQTIDDTIGQSVLDTLSSSQQPDFSTLLPPLVRDLAAVTDPFSLVLDDCHQLHNPTVLEALSFIIRHQPEPMHLLLSTRQDLPFSLAKRRAQGQLTEIRTADLRLTPQETEAFLTSHLPIQLDPTHIQRLTKQTEGWLAGLQLAVLSIKQHPNDTAYLESFAGNHRFVLDYLVEEVLRQQTSDTRRFLLETSILERLQADLCHAVTEHPDSQVMLETLEAANLFVIPLDTSRQWYRYHHLFADALRSILQQETPDTVPTLHLRASQWYAQRDAYHEAIHHALAAPHFAQAADLIEQAWSTMHSSYQTTTWMTWLQQLPTACVNARPILMAGCGWSLLYKGQLDESERWFTQADTLLQQGHHTPSTQRQRLAWLPISLRTAQAYRALLQGDLTASIQHAQHVMHAIDDMTSTKPPASTASTDPIDHLPRTQASAILGIAHWTQGNLEAAEHISHDLVTHLYAIGAFFDAIELSSLVADIRMARGHLHSTHQLYNDTLERAANRGTPVLPGIEDIHRGLALVYCEWDQLKLANTHLRLAETYSQQLVIRPNWTYRLAISWALIHVAKREWDAAQRAIDDARASYTPVPLPDICSPDALQARIWLRQGQLDKAEEWSHTHQSTLSPPVTYQTEYANITLLRLTLAQHKQAKQPTPDQETRLLSLATRLLEAAQCGGRQRSVAELHILQALYFHSQQDQSGTLTHIEQALAISERERYIRLFIDEGPVMLPLLRQAQTNKLYPAHTTELLAMLEARFPECVHERLSHQPLLDPLTKREREVLRMLQTERTGPDIARDMCVSLSTIRTHTRNIYSKLGANNRRTAIRRARELGLL